MLFIFIYYHCSYLYSYWWKRQIDRWKWRYKEHKNWWLCVCIIFFAHNKTEHLLLHASCGCQDWLVDAGCLLETLALRKDRNVNGNNGRKRHLSLRWTEGIFYELKARHISMTPCCLLYALPIYLESLDSVMWLYSCKGRSFNHRPSIQSTWISTVINRVGRFYSLQQHLK